MLWQASAPVLERRDVTAVEDVFVGLLVAPCSPSIEVKVCSRLAR
jgi:hypothetical protein